MKSRYVAATKRENDCFNNDHKIGYKMGDPDKVTEYATYFILVTVMFYYRNQIFITF